MYNNAPALKSLPAATSFEGLITVEIIDAKITNFYAMRNPDKLTGDRGPADHQPLASVTLGGCGSSGSANSAARPRCCGRRRRRSAAAFPHPPR